MDEKYWVSRDTLLGMRAHRLSAIVLASALSPMACGPSPTGTDGSTDVRPTDATRNDVFIANDNTDPTDGMSTGSADGSHDQFIPWAGGPEFYRPFAHGPSTDPSYFPIAVWLQSPSNASRYAAIGVNIFVGLWNTPTMSDLDSLRAANVTGATELSDATAAFVSNATLSAWTQQDEPDNAQWNATTMSYDPCITPAALQSIYDSWHMRDPSRPIFLNFGQGVAWTDWIGRGTCTGDVAYYQTASSAGDILSFDIYPANSNDAATAQKLWLVAEGVDRLRMDAGDHKPVWAWIETTQIDSSGGPGPTPAQTRTEVWMALVHGAMGFGYFAHRISPFDETGLLDDATMSAAVGTIDTEVRSLAPVLNTQSISNAATVANGGAGEAPIDMMVKRHGGSLYLFAVAMRDQMAHATFTVPSMPAAARIEVIGESRTLTATAGSFRDDFAGFAVHLYKLTW